MLACGLKAQDEQKKRIEHDVLTTAGPGENVFFERHAINTGGDTVQFVSMEAGIAGKVVKGAPFSAEAVTETTQTLADGNRISKKSVAAQYRDSEGRTRRDMTMPAIGPLAASGDAPSFVMINDPVAGLTYHLDTKAKTARKLPPMPPLVSFGPDTKAAGVRMRMPADVKGQVSDKDAKLAAEKNVMERIASDKAGILGIQAGPQFNIQIRDTPDEQKSESLGKQTIDGIQVEGTRSTATIKAGEIGNDRDIEIVSERWYSPELQTVVMSRHADPRMGETVYKLTNIHRGDPMPSLFQVPSDYTMVTEEAPMRFMRRIETK